MKKSGLFLVSGLLGLLLMLVAACGGDDDGQAAATATTRPQATSTSPPAPTSTSASSATATPTTEVTAPPTDTPVPSDGGPEVTLEVAADAILNEFTEASFTVAAGSQVVLKFDNTSTISQHNWTLVEAGTKDAVAAAGITAPDNGFVPPDDARVIANTKLLDAGTAGEVRFAAPAPGTYQFVCTFLGHNPTMFGDFVVQ